MNIRTTLITSSLIAASLVSGAAHAALQGRDLDGSIGSFEAYYDTDLNITWLADANINGPMNWDDASALAANLSFTDGVNIYDNWRLSTSDACAGYGCTGSEMGHLFYSELGGTTGQFILTSADPDLIKFTNLQVGRYWSAMQYDNNNAWYFDFAQGLQSADSKGNGFYVLAVSPGDVGAVPEASIWAMLLAGLGLVGVAAKGRPV